MDVGQRQAFIDLWRKYFDSAGLPIAFYYSDAPGQAELALPGKVPRCIVAALAAVTEGRSLAFDSHSVGCWGGRKHLGFTQTWRSGFEDFLSSGIPAEIVGERYKKSPALVSEIMQQWPSLAAPKPYIVFKRWDCLAEADRPEVVIFFARPDVLSGLFTLVNYDESRPESVIAPMGSGCSSLVTYPYLERQSPHPRAVLGMFDPSARSCVPQDILSFSVPFERFTQMVANMDESFLATDTWRQVRQRLT